MLNRFKIPLVVLAVILAVAILWLGVRSTHKMETQRYAMTGIVVAVDAEHGTASVHNDNIPGFMRPMEMQYKVADHALLSQLKRGDNIRATLVSDGQNTWQLENISVTPATTSH